MSSISFFRISPLLTAMATVLAIPTAKAEDKDTNHSFNYYTLPTINVIATKTGKSQVGTSTLKQEQLDTIQANNIASLLDYLPGTSMVGSPRPGGQKINIWGMSDPEDVPVTVDGSLKTFDKYRQGSVFIEPELIKKITVNKGPHNPAVSNGGFGGSIKIDTKDATDFLREDENIGGLIKYAHSSNNIQNNWTGALFAQTDNKVFDILAYYTNRNAHNVKRPDGTHFLFSAYEQQSGLIKGNIRPAYGHKISWSIMNSNHSGWEPFAAMRDEMPYPSAAEIKKYGLDAAWKRKLVYRNQNDKSASLGYEFISDNPLINLNAQFNYSKTHQHDTRPENAANFASGNMGNESWVDYVNTSFELKNTSEISSKWTKHNIVTGLQIQNKKQSALMLDKSKLKNADYNYGYYEPAYLPSGRQKIAGLYIKDDIQIKTLTLSPSLRYDWIQNKGDGNHAGKMYQNPDPKYGQDYRAKTYAGFTPRLGLLWQQTEHLGWFANYAHSWRSPSVDQQYESQFINSSTSGTSRHLQKERMHALSLGSILDYRSLLSTDDHAQLRLTYFRNRGRDEIFKRRGVMCSEVKNNPKAKCAKPASNNRNLTGYTIQGVELEANYDSQYWFAGLSLSTMKGQRDDSPVDPWFNQRTWMTNIPPRKATATLGFNIPSQHFSAGWRGIFVRRQDRSIADQDPKAVFYALPKTKGYAIHSLFAQWEPWQRKGPKINLTIDNLFNKKYYPYLGEAVSGTGRDIRFSLTQQF